MKRNKTSIHSENYFKKFLLTMIQIGLTGFGGGTALIPLIENRIVGTIDSEANISKDVIVSGITPGAMPVEIASGIGRRNFGLKGMIYGPILIGLPGTISSVVLLIFFHFFQSELYSVLLLLSKTVSIFILYIIGRYIQKKFHSTNSKPQMFLIIIGVVLLTCNRNISKLFSINYSPIFELPAALIILSTLYASVINQGKKHYLITFVPILILSLGYGSRHLIVDPVLLLVQALMIITIVLYFLKNLSKRNIHLQICIKDLLVWFLFLTVTSAIPLLIYRSSCLVFLKHAITSVFLSYGGGDAYLTIAEELFVNNFVSSDYFYNTIVVVANILPGSILCKVLSEIGFTYGFSLNGYMSGILFAIMGFSCSITISSVIFRFVTFFYDTIEDRHFVELTNKLITSVICGLLINVMLSIIKNILFA